MIKKNHKHMLLVEDDPTSRLITRKILESAGYSVSEKDNIEEAAMAAVEETPSLILLDLVIPHLTGFDFLQIRKTDKVLGKIPVLVTSNLNDKDSVLKAITLGADDYFTKPVNAQVLLKKVQKLLHDKSFIKYVYSKDSRPKLHVHLNSSRGQEYIELKVHEVDEFGITFCGPKLLSRGISYHLSGECFQDIVGSSPQLMTVVNNWLDAETQRYGGTAEFDPDNPELSKKIRKWLVNKTSG